MKATLHGHVEACDPPALAVRADGYYLALPAPDASGKLSRVDAIVRETRTVGEGKSERIVALMGVPAMAPLPPALIHNDVVCQQVIAWVEVRAPQFVVQPDDIHTEWPPPNRPSAPQARHPLDLVSLLARETADGDWDRLSPDEQSEQRLRVRHMLQAFSRAGLTEDEAAMLVRYYRWDCDEETQ